QETAYNRVLHRAGSKKRPTIASCIVQGARNDLQSCPASCREQETAYNRVLHRAGSKKRPTIASCIVQGTRNGLQSRPTSCREQETTYNRVLHRAGNKKAFLFRLNSCIFTLQWKD
ncbi:hypothetical protein, partial [Porphyromonas loveana]|uniref:hypothetical protein n=1 Tax=Porphyromonas loveana TaxID=1884669 RepID=UPI00359F6071